MKKIVLSILLFLVVVLIVASQLVPKYVVKMITEYDPLTFEEVLDYDSMREGFGIGTCTSPEDYGFTFETLQFKNTIDDLNLVGWYVEAKKPCKKCIIFVHGRWSNRLKPMKYLALVDSLSLDTLYNVFIPDLRNSGQADPAPTYMGYKFAEDLTSSMMMLAEQKDQEEFVLYGFSMGAMGTATLLGRSDLQKTLSQNGIGIEQVILDSPLSNVKEAIWREGETMGMPKLLFNFTFDHFNKQISGFGEKLRISTLLSGINIPILILQSEDDTTTPVDMLKSELSSLKSKSNIDVVYFEGPDHVRMWQDERTRTKYQTACHSFFYP